MGFRTVVITSHAKLDYSLNYLVFKTTDTTKRILLDEIDTLIVETTTVALTTRLIAELIKHKINTIFCDERHNPSSQLLPLNASYNPFKKISDQVAWSKSKCDEVWKEITKQKIINQANTLSLINKNEAYNQLIGFANQVETGDITNREGHAAKVYFNNVFGNDFTRNDSSEINAYLNYGYTVLLSLINRTIVSFGYLTQLGIHHIGETNPFNFSCDILESFRFLADEEAINLLSEKNKNFKESMSKLATKEVMIDGKTQTLNNAISIHCLSIFNALNNGDINKIKFISPIRNKNEL